MASGLDLDLALLEATPINREWVPFSVRYGYQKISDWASKTKHHPAEPGRLWELLSTPADPKGTP